MAPVRVGIVGLSANGGWAATAHVPALAAVDGYELRALAGSSAETARVAGEKYGVPLTFGDAGELARHPEVDLVVVAVKVPEHRALIEPALAAGKQVLSEWPLGVSLAETEALAEAARDRTTAVGLQGRSAPALRYLRDLIKDGYVGRVLSTSLIASGANWGPSVRAGRDYQLHPAGGATMLTIPFAHTVDTVAMVLGGFAELSATMATVRPRVRDEVTGESVEMTAPDQIAVTGVLTGGAVASLHLRGGTSPATNFHWEINGTEGTLVVEAADSLFWIAKLTLRGSRTGTLEKLTVPARYELPQLAGRSAEPSYNVAHAYARHLKGDLPDFAHAVGVHRVLDAVQRSADSGSRVVPDAK
ncbi:Gfo/Idh/MocA family protein [Amycolatopsis plumensis]|uniref:Gfo/Idh/MocA family protein n=1 Tax=Amycolatopsis plumensis TaxID=236508 RepID=A0ABV5U400_9PSEU